jgi:3',5'-cyclic AMP phosphodiesterase CpdA
MTGARRPVRRLTRRRALREALIGAGGLSFALSACASSSSSIAAPDGSTLRSRWVDPRGDGQLSVGPGESLIDRTELGPRARLRRPLLTLAHITDAHVLDASSPARVTFLDRLGPPFQSTFRPQETLTAQVLAGAAAAVRALRPQLVIQGGDLIDNTQANELEHASGALVGGRVTPGSGPDGYYGVQLASDEDPFYYRPDVDAPRHPGLLRRAARPFHSPGVGAGVLPVLGDHDALVAGESVPSPLTQSLAVGDRALWHLPPGLSLPPGVRTEAVTAPDAPPNPALVAEFLRQALAGPTVHVPPDPSRRELTFAEVISDLERRAAPGAARAAGAARLDYVLDAGPSVRLVVLDLVRRGGGSGGLIGPSQPAWLEQSLAGAGSRWVLVITHQPLEDTEGGDEVVAVLDRHPRVIAVLSGHTHRNRIFARPTAAGGHWLITTASLIDWPQQARALQLVETEGGGVAIRTWMLDHVFPGSLGSVSRELSYLDAQGGRPGWFAGEHADRNVVLFRRT